MTTTSLNIRVSGEAKISLDRIGDRTGVSQQKISDRLHEWFGKQDPGVQALILGLIPEEYAGQVAELVLKEIQSQRPAGKIGGGAGSSNKGMAAKDDKRPGSGKRR